ncbi:hypothetical protein [Bifidobacterium cuniculi]|uniref:Helix-turn-helix domain-containing protein n=1 Tax=Bifidobacterium cuniculi TaxID=1688 RepID=A0A087B3X7_9BIFI|nr:hypothetical protein [Bifidobacterium cuniculi]KFI65727.1 hypothetical protein BCUN_0222 [Bifidobacterium cuniculi]
MSATTKDASRVPLGDRLAWTLEQAAQVYSLDYKGLLIAVRHGDLDTFRAPNRDGRPGRRKVTRAAMDRWIKSMEE